MAFNSMLRIASKTLLPLAIRSVGSPRTFQRAIPTILSLERCNLGHEISRRSFVPFSTLSAVQPSVEEKLVQVIDEEIECAEEPKDVEGMPDKFPFEILDKPGERYIVLTRKYNNEIIKLEVGMPEINDEDNDAENADDDNTEIKDEDNDAENADDDNTEESARSNLPLFVTITKGDGHYLEFDVNAIGDEIKIDSFCLKHPDEGEDYFPYEGPEFKDLDDNLQEAFLKYLVVRGIKPSLTSFLLEYMTNKDNKEYLVWLKNLKFFVEK